MAIKQPFPIFSEFHEIKGIYEPSAAEQLPDGRVFVVEDEMAHAVAILTIQGDGSFEVERLDADTLVISACALNQLTGLYRTNNGNQATISDFFRVP